MAILSSTKQQGEIMLKKLGLTALATTAILLTGCGGGGGSPSNSPAQQTPTQETLKLTVGNLTIDSQSTLSRVSKTIQEGTKVLVQISLNKNDATVSLEGKDASYFELLDTASGYQLQFKGAATAGEYEVDIKASDTNGNSIVYKIKYIVHANNPINKPPVVNAGNDTTTIENQTITLRGTATDEDGNIVSYEWKLGNQVLATTVSFDYTPTNIGTDTLVFSATDDDGATTSDEIKVNVTEYLVPDLVVLNAEVIDNDGNPITENNKYEAGDTIKIKITVTNIGEGDVPARSKYYTNVTLRGDAYRHTVALLELKNLSPHETKTFTYNTGEVIENRDDNKSLTVDININKSVFDDDFWKNNLFQEGNRTNNTSNALRVYVYQTDISIQDLKVKIKDSRRNTIRDTNTIDISDDNISGNYASYCCKIKNNGLHKFNDNLGLSRMLFKTEVIGNWFTMGSRANLEPNEISQEICADIKLPKNFTTGTYTYTLDGSGINDADTSNNIESISYTIQD